MNLTIPPLSLLVILLAGGSNMPAANPAAALSSPGQPSITEIAASYPSYQKITAQPVFVNPELAMLCRGASQPEVAASIKTNGPHANAAILIYMNDAAAQTFGRAGSSYAPGAVIVKQKDDLGYFDREAGRAVRSASAASVTPDGPKRPRSANPGVGGMVKRAPGYDPAHGDWEYFYFEDAARIETGRIASCVQCHNAAKKTDYVFGTWFSRKNP